MKTVFEIKTREQVSPANQAVFDSSTKLLGFVPNMYGVIANSENALSRYVKAEFDKSSLTYREQEVVNLVVSQVNFCRYCISFHYVSLQKLGFTADQLAEIRKGTASFNEKLDALVKLSKSLTEMRGHIDGELVDRVIEAGYTKGAVIDTILLINLRGVTNYVYAALGEFKIDFPLAPDLD
ncbi:carboxymuconolactone decarboxylase family protein [Mucilaginibacter sp.]|uniref:carboxymuconolactone decarboxylase family protein n=1 Tax=Mucilaginibacter sp. TaxID=1882438 RepID=UPI0025D18117|nr:carboxymuconolactone decarboxylase family protein [Mucilaginibacter sp.]